MFLDKFFTNSNTEKGIIYSDDPEKYAAVEKLINSDIKHFIKSHNGKIKLVKVQDDIVYIELKGSCSHCPAIELTLKGFVERILKENLTWVKKVQRI
jgi:Fe-S cluster biogenesis protein NfuA